MKIKIEKEEQIGRDGSPEVWWVVCMADDTPIRLHYLSEDDARKAYDNAIAYYREKGTFEKTVTTIVEEDVEYKKG